MAETVKSLFMKARALLDEYTDDGAIIPESDIIDMQKKFILFADMAHKELYQIENEDEYPNALTTVDDVVQVDDFNAQGIVYYGAARIAPFESKELTSFFESKYDEIKTEARRRSKAVPHPITDVYGGDTDGVL